MSEYQERWDNWYNDAVKNGRLVEIEIEKSLMEELEGVMQRGEELEDCGYDNVAECWTAHFANGYEIDIKVVNARKDSGGAWSEAVLFDENGYELSHTDVDDTLANDWYLFDGDDAYIVYVKGV